VNWRYMTETPAGEWMTAAFDDSSWKQGPGGFGTRGTPGTAVRTTWNTPEIYIRREIEVPEGSKSDGLHLYIHHDEDAWVYVNGVLAAKTTGFTTDYELVEMLPAARAALKPGKNLLAARCHQTRGGQYIDVGLARTVD
jgi:hypothetical protein